MSRFVVPGPCKISFGGSAMKDLGYTKEGIIIQVTEHWTPIIDDEHGLVPSDHIYQGKAAVVSAILVDITLLKAAALFREGIANSTGDTDVVANVGTVLDSTTADQKLHIFEQDPATGKIEATASWQALIAEPLRPSQLNLQSTQELGFPIQFIIIPDAAGKLFSAIPDYLTA